MKQLSNEQINLYRSAAMSAIARFRDAARYDEPVPTSVTLSAEHVLHLLAVYDATRQCHAYDVEDHYACHRLWSGDIA